MGESSWNIFFFRRNFLLLLYHLARRPLPPLRPLAVTSSPSCYHLVVEAPQSTCDLLSGLRGTVDTSHVQLSLSWPRLDYPSKESRVCEGEYAWGCEWSGFPVAASVVPSTTGEQSLLTLNSSFGQGNLFFISWEINWCSKLLEIRMHCISFHSVANP